jgi:hypothetical protein
MAYNLLVVSVVSSVTETIYAGLFHSPYRASKHLYEVVNYGYSLINVVWRILNMAVCVVRSISKVHRPFIFQGTTRKIVYMSHACTVNVLVAILCV